jgi:uncharacterized SAM-binding protein YcdF (DUF218 family)
MKISVIIPYYNEEKYIKYTLNQISLQTLKPKEVIFINSGSNDQTEKIINKYIKEKKIKNFFNIFLNTKYPSDSKNLGVQLAKYEYVAFMDCGLRFDKDWLKKQQDTLVKKKVSIVLGSCVLNGFNFFDKGAVANTYGLNTIRACVPGTLIKKQTFLKIGFFKQYRSFYDVYWKKQVYKSNFNFTTSYTNPLKYIGTNYASNVINLFKKNFLYYKSSISFITSIYPFIYILVSLLLLIIFFQSFKSFFILLIIYPFLRISIAKRKSKAQIRFLNIPLVFNIIKTGFIIDFSNTIASYINLLKHLGIKNFISFVLVIYILIFNTPLLTLAGKKLIFYEEASTKKDLVVLVGDGEAEYFNFSYKNRLKNIIFYKDKIKNIFLITGRLSEISDSITLKGLLLQNGFNNKKILILDKNTKTSSYLNILEIKKILKTKDINETYILTSPYHSKRVKLISEKILPEIKLTVLKNIEYNYNSYIEDWRPSYKNIKNIIYEFLAIIYYKIFNYI